MAQASARAERTRRRLDALTALIALASSIACVACGPSAQRVAAEDTVRTASRAIAEVHSSGGEAPEIAPALEEAEDWLAHAEEAIDLWHTGAARSLPFETVAPCLARALGEVREALTTAGRDVPETLEEAEASAAGVTEATCPSRAR